MLLNYLKYRYVKVRMTAYLDGDLSLKARRFVARQIDENPLCYQEYIRAKQSKQELERTLPSFGKAEQSQLDNVWANIQAELNQPKTVVDTIQASHRPIFSLSYGVTVLLFFVMMLTPLALDASRASISPIPQQPAPEEIVDATTRASTPDPNSTAIALAPDTTIQVQTTLRSDIPLQNTPAPRTPGT
ncbi:MAG: hypothetical protein Phog2KO_16880 [Phototrophicaceae bacterium]